MSIERIHPDDWDAYFDAVSHAIKTDERSWLADIEVFSSAIGDQREATGIVLRGLTYDGRENRLNVMADHLEHAVVSPREIWVEPGEDKFLDSMLVVTDDGTRESILFKRSPSPS